MQKFLIGAVIGALFLSAGAMAQEGHGEHGAEKKAAEKKAAAKKGAAKKGAAKKGAAKDKIQQAKIEKGRGEAVATFVKLDKNKDGNVTKKEAGDAWGKLSALDKNKDGKIVRAELAVAKPAATKEAARDAWFKQFDTNGDGKLTADDGRPWARARTGDENKDGEVDAKEFDALLVKWGLDSSSPGAGRGRGEGTGSGDRGASLWDRLARFDTDKDGKITEQEADAVWDRIGRFDKDGDGVITKKEASGGR